MMIYLKDKEAFNLADLMAVFGISRSTALRDVAALEELGMPVFSEPGRYGGYRILDNRQVPPMSFSQERCSPVFCHADAGIVSVDAFSRVFRQPEEEVRRKHFQGERREVGGDGRCIAAGDGQAR
jgi:predicted DNA-binding transcriptional regulator YafY